MNIIKITSAFLISLLSIPQAYASPYVGVEIGFGDGEVSAGSPQIASKG